MSTKFRPILTAAITTAALIGSGACDIDEASMVADGEIEMLDLEESTASEEDPVPPDLPADADWACSDGASIGDSGGGGFDPGSSANGSYGDGSVEGGPTQAQEAQEAQEADFQVHTLEDGEPVEVLKELGAVVLLKVRPKTTTDCPPVIDDFWPVSLLLC